MEDTPLPPIDESKVTALSRTQMLDAMKYLLDVRLFLFFLRPLYKADRAMDIFVS